MVAHTHKRARIYIRIHIRLHVHINIHVYTCTIHTYIQIHIHTSLKLTIHFICQLLYILPDKCLIFSDNIPALKDYAYLLQVHMMHGGTSEEERETLLRRFRGDAREGETEINALLISRIGDVAIDLPQCNIIIQIASHFGSRRQVETKLLTCIHIYVHFPSFQL